LRHFCLGTCAYQKYHRFRFLDYLGFMEPLPINSLPLSEKTLRIVFGSVFSAVVCSAVALRTRGRVPSNKSPASV